MTDFLHSIRSINPHSRLSGIKYSMWPGRNGTEMEDVLPYENFLNALQGGKFRPLLGRIADTYRVLMGNHGGWDDQMGTKGLLDYLLLPLIARKIIGDFLSNPYSPNTLLLPIAIGLEMARVAAGVGLTVGLTPLVVLIHCVNAIALLCESYMNNQNVTTTPSL